MKISQSFLVSKSNFWWLPGPGSFPANSLLCVILRYTVYTLLEKLTMTDMCGLKRSVCNRYKNTIRAIITRSWILTIHKVRISQKKLLKNAFGLTILSAIVLDLVDCVWLYSFFKYKKIGSGYLNHCHQTQSKTKKRPHIFLRLEADFFWL